MRTLRTAVLAAVLAGVLSLTTGCCGFDPCAPVADPCSCNNPCDPCATPCDPCAP